MDVQHLKPTLTPVQQCVLAFKAGQTYVEHHDLPDGSRVAIVMFIDEAGEVCGVSLRALLRALNN